MRYVVYVDVFFVINLIMDFIILSFAKSFIKNNTTSFKCFLGAIFGAASSCIMINPWFTNIFIDYCIKYIIIVLIMNYITFRCKELLPTIKAILIIYGITFLIGGIMNFLYYHTYAGVLVTNLINGFVYGRLSLLKCIGYTLISYGVVYFVLHMVDNNKPVVKQYRVVVSVSGRELSLRGIYDSGNMLKEPIDGKAVHVLSDNIKMLINEDEWKSFRIVPYNSVGNTGILQSIIVDSMKVCDEFGNIIYENKDERVAFSDRKVSFNDEFDILLNRNIIENMI